jgi:hypothetical protein
MKCLSHSIRRKVRIWFCGLLFSVCIPLAYAADKTASVQSVRLLPQQEGATVEIVVDQLVKPQMTQLESPRRLVIDLPYTDTSLRGKRLGSQIKDISAVRIDQYTVKPPVARIVVDLREPMTFRTETVGHRILVHLSPEEHTPPTVPTLTRTPEPAVVPVSPANSGGVTMDGSLLATGSSISAGSDTAILHLTRGGEVRVCAGTTISVTSAKSGTELMLGVSTGSLEAHYTLGSAADSVLTPDFRLLLAGPGEFDYAMSVNAHGDTCVRALPGNNAAISVSELMGNGTYQLNPDEQIVFRSGQLTEHDTNVPLNCGCGEPKPEILRASEPSAPLPSESLPSSVHLAEPGDSPAATAASASDSAARNIAGSSQTGSSTAAAVPSGNGSNDVQVQVDAPLVFQGNAPHTPTAPIQEVAQLQTDPPAGPKLPTSVALPPASNSRQKEHRGFFGSIGRFFKSIFH